MSRTIAVAAVCLLIACLAFALRSESTRTPTAEAVSSRVIQAAEAAVIKVRCSNVNVSAEVLSAAIGTGFVTRAGIITAAHVIASCGASGPGSISAGPFVVGVSVDDPAVDLALMRLGATGPAPLPLQPALPSSGTPVELLGSAGLSNGPSPEPVAGTVVATNTPVTLFGENGSSERLTDSIVVAATGAAPGYSGGPAIDASGAVVGVIEGAGDGRAYLTPTADIVSDLG